MTFFWYLIRIFSNIEVHYKTAQPDLEVLSQIIISSIGIFTLFLFSTPLSLALKKKFRTQFSIKQLIYFGTILNAILIYVLDGNERYSSSGFTVDVLFLYYLRGVVALVIVVKAISNSDNFTTISKVLYFITTALTLDGMSSALNLFCLFILFTSGLRFRFTIVTLSVPIFFVVALISKGQAFLNQFDLIYPWVIARFSIVLEPAFLYTSGLHYLKDLSDLIELLKSTISCRLSFAIESSKCMDIQSVSNANYYTLYGSKDGGSTPGLLGSFILSWHFSLIPFIIFSAATVAIFSKARSTSFIEIIAFSILIRGVYTNFIDAYSVLSFSLLLLIGYVLSAKVRFKHEK